MTKGGAVSYTNNGWLRTYRRPGTLPRRILVLISLAFAAQVAAADDDFVAAIQASPGNCGNLASLKLPNTMVTATYVAQSATTPGYCDVRATVSPQTDIEIWLPDRWSQRYLHLGGGGFDGSIPNLSSPPAAYNVNPVARGYVVAGSNGGHRGTVYP